MTDGNADVTVYDTAEKKKVNKKKKPAKKPKPDTKVERDPEMVVMENVLAELKKLTTPGGVERILRYAADVHEIDLTDD